MVAYRVPGNTSDKHATLEECPSWFSRQRGECKRLSNAHPFRCVYPTMVWRRTPPTFVPGCDVCYRACYTGSGIANGSGNGSSGNVGVT